MIRRFTIGILLISGIGIAYNQWFSPSCLSCRIQPTKPLEVMILKTDTTSSIANKLYDAGIIERRLPLFLALNALELAIPIKWGHFNLKPDMTVWGVAQLLTKRRETFRMTFPEGLTVQQMIKMIKEKKELAGDVTTFPQEGSLFPSTYHCKENDSRDRLILRMKDQMDKKLSYYWKKRDKNLPYESMTQALTMASIIEKETAVKSERALVARVFINRLALGMPLQADPTVIYGLTLGLEKLGRQLTRADWKNDSVFNTYKIEGLPPTPIACPGESSIQAALHPEKTDALYFVADGKGGHVFAKDLKKHNKNVLRKNG